nr:immunoglobulin heavy chain junction region [Mus musculus]MBK4184751.1 immunoglobulin heavy chain junction region [Mus musculus]
LCERVTKGVLCYGLL